MSPTSTSQATTKTVGIIGAGPAGLTAAYQLAKRGYNVTDHAYRDEVDAIFKQIYREGRFQVMPETNGPLLIELWGSREQRLRQLQDAIEEVNALKIAKTR